MSQRSASIKNDGDYSRQIKVRAPPKPMDSEDDRARCCSEARKAETKDDEATVTLVGDEIRG